MHVVLQTMSFVHVPVIYVIMVIVLLVTQVRVVVTIKIRNRKAKVKAHPRNLKQNKLNASQRRHIKNPIKTIKNIIPAHKTPNVIFVSCIDTSSNQRAASTQ